MVGLLCGAVIAEIYGPRIVFIICAVAAIGALPFALRLPDTREQRLSGPRFAKPGAISIWSFCMGFALDGLFIFGLALLAKANMPQGAVIAAGAAVAASRYMFEILLSPAGGVMAERWGARRLMVVFSLMAAGGLVLLGLGHQSLWIGAIAVIILRALLQPLPAPVVAEAFQGNARVSALARQATWRDIGAGTGPLAAGLLFPVLPALTIYACSAGMLAAASIYLLKRKD